MGRPRYEPERGAVASGHGVGKTTLVAWLILWFLSTRPSPNVVVTANTNAVLTGAILSVGPPWPEDPEAYRLLGEVDQKMRQALRGLARLNPERGAGAGNMLIHMSDDDASGLAGAIERFAERYAIAARAA